MLALTPEMSAQHKVFLKYSRTRMAFTVWRQRKQQLLFNHFILSNKVLGVGGIMQFDRISIVLSGPASLNYEGHHHHPPRPLHSVTHSLTLNVPLTATHSEP